MVLSLTASFSAFGIEEQPALISPQFVGTPGIDDIPFCIDEDVITDAEHTVRLRYLETEDNVAAFSNPDGSATMYYFSNPIKYTDIYGNTVDIDNTVETFGELTDEYKFKTKSAPATTYLPATIGMGENVKVEHNGFSVQIIPMSDRFAAGTTVASELKTGKDSAVLYSNVFGTGRSLKYTTLYNGVKEDIILNSYVANANSFNFIVKTNGLELAEIDGRYVFRDTLGIPMFELSPIFVYDSAEIPNSTGGTYTVEMIKENDIYALTLTVDEAWLSGATYPVTIDPTVTYNTDSGIEDASSAQNDPFINGSAFVFYVGNYGSSVARAYIRFPNLVIPPSAFSMITSANLHLKSQSVSMSPGISIEGYSINSSWTEDGYYASSFPYNNYKTSPMVSGGIGSYTSNHTLDVTNLVRDWGGTDSSIGANRGILLKTSALNEASTYYAVFHSSEASNAADRPYLTITTSSVELPTTQQEGIRDNRFYWVSSGTSFLTQSVASLGRYPTPSARDYTNTAQRLLFTYAGSGKYRISTESSPTNYLTLNGNSLLFQAQSTSGNQLWYVGNTNGSSYYIINAADTTKSLTTNGTSVTCSTSSVTNWTFEKCPTFYGQYKNIVDGYTYWNANNLDNLYFPNSPNSDSGFVYSAKPFILANSNDDVMSRGCVISSYAMILDNLNKKSINPIKDLRYITTNYTSLPDTYVIPDPFTCTLSNINWLTTAKTQTIINEYLSTGIFSCSYGGIPVSASASGLSSEFNATASNQLTYPSDCDTIQEKAEYLRNLLSNNPEGVAVRVSDAHTIVVSKYLGYTSTPDTVDEWNDLFVVYDPAATTSSAGNGCKWSDCATYQNRGGLDDVSYFITFD